MSRRGWKDQRAALFEERSLGLAPPRRNAAPFEDESLGLGTPGRNAALLEDVGVAFGAPEPCRATQEPEASDADDVWADPEIVLGAAQPAEERAPHSGIWGDVPAASSVWSAEPPVAPVRRKRTRRLGLRLFRRRGRKRAEQRNPFDVGGAAEPEVEAALLLASPPPLARESGRARVLREAVAEPPARRAAPKRPPRRWLAPREEPLPKDLVGRDLAGGPPRRARVRRRLPLALLGGGIVAALLLVTLRVEILRLRYAVAEVAAEEQALAERIAQAKFRLRELRDPARLRKLAAERGFVRPERVLQVELPPSGRTRRDPERERGPQVAAGPAPEVKP
jgi:hypothetical protein